MENSHVVVSGCSGGGKSTLLGELELRGFLVVSEPGRRIVEEELRGDGSALPWRDLSAFASLAMKVAADDRERVMDKANWVFFDRGLVDAAVAFEHSTGRSAEDLLARYPRYHQRVFLTPPWPEIYVTDNARRHQISEAVEEYDRLVVAYRELGYDVVVLPKVPVDERANFILRHLNVVRPY
jgi:predicted ATPase